MFLSYSPGGLGQLFLDIGTPVTDPQTTPPGVTPQDIRKARKLAQSYRVKGI